MINPLPIWRTLSLLQRIGVSIGIVIALVGAWKLFWHVYDSNLIGGYEAEVTEQVIETSTAASTAAVEAAAVAKSEVEKTNEQARKAAHGSDDPLKSGLDRLRTGTR